MVKIIFFDCDGVLTFGSIWERLNRFVGLDKSLSPSWAKEYYSGKITFREWERRIEEVYKKARLTKTQFQRLLEPINLNPDALSFLKYLNRNHPEVKKGIISSSLNSFVEKVAKKLKLDFWRANSSLVFDEKGFFKGIKSYAEDPIAKVLHVKEICKIYKVNVRDTIFIGDSYNDIEAFKYTGRGILYKTRDPKLEKFATKRIESFSELERFLQVLNFS